MSAFRWTAGKERKLRALDRKVQNLKAKRAEVLEAIDLAREKRLAIRSQEGGLGGATGKSAPVSGSTPVPSATGAA